MSIEKINKNIFISASRDQNIIVWENFKIKYKIKNHNATILSLCRLDNTRFASSGGDKKIFINKIDGSLLKTLDDHKDWVWKILKLNNNRLVSCSEDCTIKIWDIQKSKSIFTFESNVPIISLDFHHKLKLLISGDLKGRIVLRKLNDDYSEKTTFCFKAHKGIIRCIKIINDFSFATGGEDYKLKVWTFSGEILKEFIHDDFVQSIVVYNKNKLISASYDGSIQVHTI